MGSVASGGKPLQPTSVVHRQAAFAVSRLLAADASQREGATLKSLTLAPHIEAKKVGQRVQQAASLYRATIVGKSC